jgi:hypothetical protein
MYLYEVAMAHKIFVRGFLRALEMAPADLFLLVSAVGVLVVRSLSLVASDPTAVLVVPC